jgi:tRNA(Ile)-lysidine synthetase-like protein
MIKVNPLYVPKKDFTFMVSGGVDSIAAAHWLMHKYMWGTKFTILHFNHDIQPVNHKMQYAVQRFVERFSNGFTRGTFITRHEVLDAAFKNDTSEDGMRRWRHHKLEGLGGNFVTAHHLGDCVESYLMNCFHGKPEHQPITWSTYFMGNFSIFHPFLETTKEDFIAYAEANDLMKYVVEDPTNKETTQKRNWIRNHIVPQLEERQMGIDTIVRKKFYTIKTEL